MNDTERQTTADFMDLVDLFAAAVIGFRNRMEAAGFAKEDADEMAMEFHRAMCTGGGGDYE